MKNFIKNFYATVKDPETVNVATVTPPGAGVKLFAPGAIDTLLGAVAVVYLSTTTPDPPFPVPPLLHPAVVPPPVPPPLFAAAAGPDPLTPTFTPAVPVPHGLAGPGVLLFEPPVPPPPPPA